MLHWWEPTKSLKWYAMEASLVRTMLYKFGKASLRAWSPHHRSCQNIILEPSHTSNLVWLENIPNPLLYSSITPPIWPINLIRTPPTSWATKFRIHHNYPQNLSLMHIASTNSGPPTLPQKLENKPWTSLPGEIWTLHLAHSKRNLIATSLCGLQH
jgi:hypothetical protein